MTDMTKENFFKQERFAQSSDETKEEAWKVLKEKLAFFAQPRFKDASDEVKQKEWEKEDARKFVAPFLKEQPVANIARDLFIKTAADKLLASKKGGKSLTSQEAFEQAYQHWGKLQQDVHDFTAPALDPNRPLTHQVNGDKEKEAFLRKAEIAALAPEQQYAAWKLEEEKIEKVKFLAIPEIVSLEKDLQEALWKATWKDHQELTDIRRKEAENADKQFRQEARQKEKFCARKDIASRPMKEQDQLWAEANERKKQGLSGTLRKLFSKDTENDGKLGGMTH